VKSDLSTNFLYRLSASFENKLNESLEELDEIIMIRQKKLQLYNRLLDFNNDLIVDYHYSSQAVPWRKNIFVPKSFKNKIVNRLLNHNIPVSDWYPVVADMFGDENLYVNAKVIEDTILNFPLLISDEEIYRISNTVNSIVKIMN
jgi:dTDP-4-amino-4,6-dideoxygalactose transaminase